MQSVASSRYPLEIKKKILEELVGLAGFEPTTFRPPDERATKLRYSPMAGV